MRETQVLVFGGAFVRSMFKIYETNESMCDAPARKINPGVVLWRSNPREYFNPCTDAQRTEGTREYDRLTRGLSTSLGDLPSLQLVNSAVAHYQHYGILPHD
jgi:hypothetical protein